MSTDDNAAVLVPDDDEPMVKIGAGASSSKGAYHTRDCGNVIKMNREKSIPLSQAEWLGLDECERCIQNPDLITAAAVDEIRRRVLDGETLTEVAAAYRWGRAVIANHIKGRHEFTHAETEEPAVTWERDTGWTAVADDDRI